MRLARRAPPATPPSGSRGRLACRCLFLLALIAGAAIAGGFDHVVSFDNSGIWRRGNQQALLDTLVAGEIVGALWLGGQDRLGRTFWQAIDSSALGAVSAEAAKRGFTRARPDQSGDPHDWFAGRGHYSFPSGEVTSVTAIVTPFMFEYGPDHPAIYALGLLPAYDAIARVKSQAHWQTDVLASVALGTLTGYLAHRRDNPFILGLLPQGFMIGMRARF
jgi:undecaprenyl-diphosphatase